MYSIAADQTFALSPNTNDSMGMRSIWSATSLTHTFGSQVNFASIDWDFNTFMLEVEAAQTTSQFNTITTYVHEVIPLQHPRPERRAAHMLAVEKFEQDALMMDGSKNMDHIEWIPSWVPRLMPTDVYAPGVTSILPVTQRAVGSNRQTGELSQQPPEPIRKPVFYAPPIWDQKPLPQSPEWPPRAPSAHELEPPRAILALRKLMRDGHMTEQQEKSQVVSSEREEKDTASWLNEQRYVPPTQTPKIDMMSIGSSQTPTASERSICQTPEDEYELFTDSEEDIDDSDFDYGDLDSTGSTSDDEEGYWTASEDFDSESDYEDLRRTGYDNKRKARRFSPTFERAIDREDGPELELHWTSDMPMDAITYILSKEVELRQRFANRAL